MIQARIRTEYHFNMSERTYAKLDVVVARLKELGCTTAAIMDCTTYGHIQFHKRATKAGINPLLGVEYVCSEKEKVGLIAVNDAGLRELYALLSEPERLPAAGVSSISSDVAKLLITPMKTKGWKNAFAVVDPSNPVIVAERLRSKLEPICCSDNFYTRIEDRGTFGLLGGAVRADPMQPQHILSADELARLGARYGVAEALKSTQDAFSGVRVALPTAPGLKMRGNLEKLARAGIARRGFKGGKLPGKYEARLMRELTTLREKGFEDYLLLLADTVGFARKRMLVGPARGSSAGSLICYLTGITEVDPMQYDLLFERFVDITRSDLPDIDVDFPEGGREIVFAYLQKKYGAENVAKLGTIQTWQPRSMLVEVGKRMRIPPWELQKLKDSLIERADGDARADLCLFDTLEQTDPGREAAKKYPSIRRVTGIENHAKHSGTHAGGVIVSPVPVKNFAALQADGTAQLDKKDAEVINLLKLDLLGLKALTGLGEVFAELSIDPLAIPLDDPDTFAVLQAGRFAAVFQFEGQAMQQLARGMGKHLTRFEDIVALNALSRPGPLQSGGAATYIDRRTGNESIEHLHSLVEPITRETMGVIVYQEQLMSIAREVGGMTWEEVTELRRIVGKSLGEEAFGKYWESFRDGAAKKHRLSEKVARSIWDRLKTMGGYAFNKSHSVAYSLLSYWCAYLKAHHFVAFAAAALRHAKDDDKPVLLLRELQSLGFDYVAFDPDRSAANWTVQDGELIGGFMNIVGVGDAKAAKFLEQRPKGWTKKDREFFANADVLFRDLNPARSLWGHVYDDPGSIGLRIRNIMTISELDGKSRVAFIGKLKVKNLRDLNEHVFQVKRQQQGKPLLIEGKPTAYMNLVMEDDTGQLSCGINASDFQEFGRDIAANGVVDKTWYVMQGFRNNYTNRISVTWAKELTTNEGKKDELES